MWQNVQGTGIVASPQCAGKSLGEAFSQQVLIYTLRVNADGGLGWRTEAHYRAFLVHAGVPEAEGRGVDRRR